jgi:carboxypeptidase Q
VTRLKGLALALVLCLVPTLSWSQEEKLDWETINRIREEGFARSQVLETVRYLTDEIGPRLTGSPGGQAASLWTKAKLAEWGLAKAALEPWGPFGRGWSFSRSSVHLVAPRETPLLALPSAWTPGTAGAVRGQALKLNLTKVEDFEKHKGKLAGKILFTADARAITAPEEAAFRRRTDEQLEELLAFNIPGTPNGPDEQARNQAKERREFRKKLNEFLAQEKVLATVTPSSRNGGTLTLGGAGSRETGESVGVPALVMAAEQYNGVVRMLENEKPVELELDVRAQFHDTDLMAYNTVAEIPGSDLSDEIVMLGAHLDSWHAATGANDNAAGSAVVMEAVRIIKALGLKPRRTIRIALWTGEEQGLLGSRAYVEQHFASRPDPEDPEELKLPKYQRQATWPIQPKPEHEKLSVYFNLDNGSGKIRGVYGQSNAAAAPIFKRWLEPFHDLGATTVSTQNTGSTDHAPYDSVGLPGFQFVQDPLDYSSLTHHTNLDVFDHAVEADLKQASVIIASFVYHAAMRDQRFPRKPLPQKPAERKKAKEVPES